MQTNTGYNHQRELAGQEDTDYVFGAITSPVCMALIPIQERVKYLPKGEVQKGKDDWMDCASRSPINELEAKFTYLYQKRLLTPAEQTFFEKNGYIQDGRVTFSDRFIAILSGTDRTGNSLKAPLQAIHEYGLIPKAMLPADKRMTFEQYHDATKITPEMKEIGKQSLTFFTINYERVYEDDFEQLLEEDMIGVAGYAWPKPVKGVYPRTDRSPNHAFLVWGLPHYQAFDNYEEGKGDFIKQLAHDFDFAGYGYRVYVSRNYETARLGLMQKIIDLYKQLIGLLTKPA